MSISKSKIDYLTHVWNSVVGCRVGCPYCWCGPLLKRIGAAIGCELCSRNVPHVHPERLDVPGGKPKVIGLGFMTDLFGNDAWKVIDDNTTWPRDFLLPFVRGQLTLYPQHTFVTPTKFPGGIPEDLNPPDNWWLLVTCTNQAEVDRNLPEALKRWAPGRVVLNLEPLCGRVLLDNRHQVADEEYWNVLTGERGATCQHVAVRPAATRRVAGVILGGMSPQPGAPEPVPMDPDWVRRLRDQCATAGVPFFYKQFGPRGADHPPLLDGRTHRALPWRHPLLDRITKRRERMRRDGGTVDVVKELRDLRESS